MNSEELFTLIELERVVFADVSSTRKLVWTQIASFYIRC